MCTEFALLPYLRLMVLFGNGQNTKACDFSGSFLIFYKSPFVSILALSEK